MTLLSLTAASAQDQQAASTGYTVSTTAGNGGPITIPVLPSSAEISNDNAAQQASYEISPAAAANTNSPQTGEANNWAWQAAIGHAHN